MKRVLLVAALGLGCTDAEMAQFGALGAAGHIICYSGGAVIYEGDSSGKIATEDGSDGWYFREAKSGRLIRTNADCIITN